MEDWVGGVQLFSSAFFRVWVGGGVHLRETNILLFNGVFGGGGVKGSSMDVCPRNARCLKGAGHAGWCKTRPDGGAGEDHQSQDSLFAARAAKRPKRAASNAASSKATAIQALVRKRGSKHGNRRSGRTLPSDDDDDDDDDDGDGLEDEDEDEDEDVEYEDHGVSQRERKRTRSGSFAMEDEDEDEAGADEEGEEAAEDSDPAAPLAELESIRLRRQMLEKWLLEPFFASLVRGCLVRIGLQANVGEGSSSTIYRVAEVVGVKDHPDHPYNLGGRQTCTLLHLQFGESKQWYPMASISNQPFEELELRSWQQVLEVSEVRPVSGSQLRSKIKALQEVSSSQASDSKSVSSAAGSAGGGGGGGGGEVARKGTGAALTTRQKLLAQHAGGTAPSDLVAK